MAYYKKLTKKELKASADICRQWQPMYKEVVAKIFQHLKAQEQEIETLERHLSELRQANFFKKSAELSAPEPLPPPKEKPRKYPLAERLTMMEKGSKEWKLALGFNQLTEAQAERLIEEFKQG